MDDDQILTIIVYFIVKAGRKKFGLRACKIIENIRPIRILADKVDTFVDIVE